MDDTWSEDELRWIVFLANQKIAKTRSKPSHKHRLFQGKSHGAPIFVNKIPSCKTRSETGRLIFTNEVQAALKNMMDTAERRSDKGNQTYPTQEARDVIVQTYGITLMQVNNFASNYRRRVQEPSRKK